MLTFLKKNAITLLIGLIIGSIVTGLTAMVFHIKSKETQTLAHERVLAQKNLLLKQCIEKPSNAITNEFNPEIGKNKKGNIHINTIPNIENDMRLPKLKLDELITDGIQRPKSNLESKEPPKTKRKRKKRSKGNW